MFRRVLNLCLGAALLGTAALSHELPLQSLEQSNVGHSPHGSVELHQALSDGEALQLAGRSLQNLAARGSTGLTATLLGDGRLQLSELPDSEKRPFKLAYYFDFSASPDRAAENAFLQDTLIPAVASYLSRWMRVRHPSGPMDFSTKTDDVGEPIPPGPDGNGEYDADFLLKVKAANSTGGCSRLRTFASHREPLTKRPIFGVLELCRFAPDPEQVFTVNLQTTISVVMGLLAFSSSRYESWLGPQAVADVVRTVFPPDDPEDPLPPGPLDIGSYSMIVSPNVLREARLHFGCPELEGALLEERGGASIGNYWSMRHFHGSVMHSGVTSIFSRAHYGREAFTDIDLAALQDTGWYDVKYASGGFNPYGFQAGCALVIGTTESARQDARASQFLCTPAATNTSACLFDYSGQGVCGLLESFVRDTDVYDDFFVVDTEYDGRTVDCQSVPGSRCINQAEAAQEPDLVCQTAFSCSATGQVLVAGSPCIDFFGTNCPPDELMCGSPGLLTCATPELNDCNGRGDCKEGRCFCHLGWGGDDCTVPVCTTGCPGGAPCPASGFCGVPECGEWSVGDTGKGVPCTRN